MNVSATYNPYAPAPTTPAPAPTTPAPTTPGVDPSTYNPYTDPQTGGGTSSYSDMLSFSTDFNSISSMAANGAGGGFTAFKLGSTMSGNIKNIFSKNFMTGIKGTVITGFKGAGLSALVSAGVSAAANGVGVATGQVSSDQAISNVVKDTIGGAVGGLAAVTAGGVGHMLLGRFGTIGTIASVALGAVGGIAGGQIAQKFSEGL